jgi:hypothetical protein
VFTRVSLHVSTNSSRQIQPRVNIACLEPKSVILDTALLSLATDTTNRTLTNKNTGHPTVGYQKAGNRLSFIVVSTKEGSQL